MGGGSRFRGPSETMKGAMSHHELVNNNKMAWRAGGRGRRGVREGRKVREGPERVSSAGLSLKARQGQGEMCEVITSHLPMVRHSAINSNDYNKARNW